LPVESAIERLREQGIYRAPEHTQHYRSSRPILELLPRLQKDVGVACYLSGRRSETSDETGREVFILTFRARMGRLQPERWKELLLEEVYESIRCAQQEVGTILSRVGERGAILNLPPELEEALREEGCSVERIEFDRILKPMDVLKMKVRNEVRKGERLSRDEVIHLVKKHVEFTELVLRKGFEGACAHFDSCDGIS
jgi:hypothetical protein